MINRMEALLRDRTLLYVTGKGGVGKTTVAAAIGLAAAQLGRRTIVCEVAEQDRMSRAFARQGVRPEQEVELAPDLWAITVDPTKALEEWLSKQLGGGPGPGGPPRPPPGGGGGIAPPGGGGGGGGGGPPPPRPPPSLAAGGRRGGGS